MLTYKVLVSIKGFGLVGEIMRNTKFVHKYLRKYKKKRREGISRGKLEDNGEKTDEITD